MKVGIYGQYYKGEAISYIEILLKTLAQTTALTCSLALPLHAQEQTVETPITVWDTFSLENIITLFVQSAMPSLRALADVRYDQIDVDLLSCFETFAKTHPFAPLAATHASEQTSE